jgi:hypothetical protein
MTTSYKYLIDNFNFLLGKILCSNDDLIYFFSNQNSKDLYLRDQELSEDIVIYHNNDNPVEAIDKALDIINKNFYNRGMLGNIIDIIDTIKMRFYILTLLIKYLKTNNLTNLKKILSCNVEDLSVLPKLFLKDEDNNIILYDHTDSVEIKIMMLSIQKMPDKYNLVDRILYIFKDVKIFKYDNTDTNIPELKTEIIDIAIHPNKLRIEVCYKNNVVRFNLKCAVADTYLIHTYIPYTRLAEKPTIFHIETENYLETIDINRSIYIYTEDTYKQINIYLEYFMYKIECLIPCKVNETLVYPNIIIDNMDQTFLKHSNQLQENKLIEKNLKEVIVRNNNYSDELYVYRYQSMNLFKNKDDDISLFNLSIGQELFFPIFMSTTLITNYILHYFVNSSTVLLKIKLDLKKPEVLKNFLIITSYSYTNDEYEVLINRNSIFKITKISDVLLKSGKNITMRCIELDFIDCSTDSTYGCYIKKPPIYDTPTIYPDNIDDIKYITHTTSLGGNKPAKAKVENNNLINLLDNIIQYKLFYINYMYIFNIYNVDNDQYWITILIKLKDIIENYFINIIDTEIISNQKRKYLKYKNKYLLQKLNNLMISSRLV